MTSTLRLARINSTAVVLILYSVDSETTGATGTAINTRICIYGVLYHDHIICSTCPIVSYKP